MRTLMHLLMVVSRENIYENMCDSAVSIFKKEFIDTEKLGTELVSEERRRCMPALKMVSGSQNVNLITTSMHFLEKTTLHNLKTLYCLIYDPGSRSIYTLSH